MERREQEDLQTIKDAIDEVEGDKETLLKIYDLYVQKGQIYKQLSLERHQLEKKYEEKFQPILKQRAEEMDKKPVQDFWLTAMKNHALLDQYIFERDHKLLKSLKDIRSIRHTDDLGFSLEFEFNPNEWIENQILYKRYYMPQEGIVSKIEGTEIQWKGQNITQKVLQKKQKNKKNNATRVVSKTVEAESFFNFFKTFEFPNEGEIDPAQEEELIEKLDEDLEIGQEIMDELIPHALPYFLGLREAEDYAPQEGGEAVSEDEVQEAQGSGKRKKKGGTGPPEAAGKKEGDCKQQ